MDVADGENLQLSLDSALGHALFVFDAALSLEPANCLTGGASAAWLPDPTPGSYLVREYSRHLGRVTAFDSDSGDELACRKTAKNRYAFTSTNPNMPTDEHSCATETTNDELLWVAPSATE